MVYKIPIILCDAEGKVIFKNTSAKKWVRNPTKSHGINRYIVSRDADKFDRLCALAKYKNENAGSDKVRNSNEIIEIHSLSVYKRALAGIYEQDGVHYLILLFISFLQIHYLDESCEIIERQIQYQAEQIIQCVKEYDMANPANAEGKIFSSVHDIHENIYHILEYILSKIPPSNADFSLYRILDIFRQAALPQFLLRGYKLEFEIINIPKSEKYRIDYKSIMLIYMSLLLFSLEQSKNNRVYTSVCIDELDLSIKIKGTLENPPFYVINAENLLKLVKYYPSDCINMYVCDLLLKQCNVDLSYTIIEKNENNFTITLKIPLPDYHQFGMILHSKPEISAQTEQQVENFLEFLLHIL